MSYQKQLVVRTNTDEGMDTIDQIKAIAKATGRTHSEIALYLIQKGLEEDVTLETLEEGLKQKNL